MTLILPSPAKINTFLHIIGQRADGYHLLQTVFQFINLSDKLTFDVCETPGIHLQGDLLDIPAEKNLIYKAASALMPFANEPANILITIEKHIPTGAGLGGGSSNAATTLVALNHLWNCQCSYSQLHAMALTLGADVPVFLLGHAAFAEGIGEILTPMEPEEKDYLLVFPQQKVSTPALYRDCGLTRDTSPIRIADLLAAETRNDFQKVARQRYTTIDKAFQWLESKGYSEARLSGSGSAIWLALPSSQAAGNLQSQLPTGLKGVVCRGHNISEMFSAACAAGISFSNWGVAKR